MDAVNSFWFSIRRPAVLMHGSDLLFHPSRRAEGRFVISDNIVRPIRQNINTYLSMRAVGCGLRQHLQ